MLLTKMADNAEILEHWNRLYAKLSKSNNPFEQIAYRQLSDSKLEELVLYIKKKLKLRKVHMLLDIGCGNLHISSRIHNYARFAVGADFSFPLILKAKKFKKSRLVQCEAAYFPFKNNYFNRVICYNAFQYFPSKEYARKVIKELLRVTKKGGIIMIGDVPSKPQKFISNDIAEFVYSVFLPPIRLFYQFLRYKIFRLKKPIGLLYYDKSFFKGFEISKPFPMNKHTHKYRFDCVLKK